MSFKFIDNYFNKHPKFYIKLINYFPNIKKRLERIVLEGKEFRFIGNHLEYFPAEVPVNGKLDIEVKGNIKVDNSIGGIQGFNCSMIAASFYPRKFLNEEWDKFVVLKRQGILLRQNKKGKWEYITSSIFKFEKVDFNVMCQEMDKCLSTMIKLPDYNNVTKHNNPDFKQYIIKEGDPIELKLPVGVIFDALRVADDEWYIGDESRPMVGKAGDYLVVFRDTPYKFTQEEKIEMKWELVYDETANNTEYASDSEIEIAKCGRSHE